MPHTAVAAAPPEPSGLHRPALLFAAAAVPVVIASFAGWAFGLAFVALGLIATGFLRNARLATVLKAGAVVTALSLGASVLLANLESDDADTTSEPAPTEQAEPEPPKAEAPAAEKPEEPANDSSERAERAERRERRRERAREQAPPPDKDTEGLVRVPPGEAEPEESAPPAPTDPEATQPPSTGTQP